MRMSRSLRTAVLPTLCTRHTAVQKLAGKAAGLRAVDPLEARRMLSGDGFERIDLPADAGSSTVVVADFDKNGMMDVATSNAGAGTLSVLLNSAGGFSNPVNYEVGGAPTGLQVLDINADEKPDLVAYDVSGRRLVLLTNDGDGTFSDHGSIAAPEGATLMAAAHLNRDSSMEVIVAFESENRIAVYGIVDTGDPDHPTGIDYAHSYEVGGAPSAISFGDVNTDGAMDIIVSSSAGGKVSVLLNTTSTASTAELVSKLYHDVLGRGPTDQESSAGVATLASGENGRRTLVEQLLESDEFTDTQLRNTFSQIMERDPSEDEMGELRVALASAGDVVKIRGALVASNLFFSGPAQNERGKFIIKAHALLLGTPAAPLEINHWMSELAGGASRMDVVQEMMDGPGFRDALLKTMFDHYLHHLPSAGELAVIFGNMLDDAGSEGGDAGAGDGTGNAEGSGGEDVTMTEVLARILVSDAYFHFAGGGTGIFQSAAVYTVGLNPSAVSVALVNGDLKPDLLVPNTGSDTVSVLLGTEGGGFEAGPVVNVGDQPVHTMGYFVPGRGFTLVTVSRGEDSISGHGINLDGKVELFGVIKVGDMPSWIAPGRFSPGGGNGMAIANAGDGTVTIITFTGEHGDGTDSGGSGGGGGTADGGFDDVAVPDAPDLASFSDLGQSNSDNITPLNNSAGRSLAFMVGGVVQGQFVNLFIDGVRMGSALVRSDEGHVYIATDGFTVLADGVHQVTATITVGGREGKRSDALAVTIKTPRVEVNNADPNEPTNGDGSRARSRVDEMGRPIVTVEDGQGGSHEYNLDDEFNDSTSIQGDLVVVDEVKHQYGQGAGAHARRYAAGQTNQGLLLYINNEDGSWSRRNLTEDISGAEAFASDDLDVLTTPWGNSNIFGKNDQGELVAYWQDGSEGDAGFNWNFVNLGEHLAQTSQGQPAWSGDIECYSVPWGGMNVVAVDDNGDVTAVWWAPGLDHWVYTNLSEITGAPDLVGTVSVSVTPWGGVSVLGTDALGHSIALWWAPGYEWQVTDMTLLAGAPDFAAGSASSFTSPSGDIVVAGLTEAGNVAIFRWTLNDQTWRVTEITPPAEITSELVGQVTGYSNANSELFVLASNIDGAVVKFSFDAGQDQWDVSLV